MAFARFRKIGLPTVRPEGDPMHKLYTEIKQSDWLKIGMGFGIANHSALFQQNRAMLI